MRYETIHRRKFLKQLGGISIGFSILGPIGCMKEPEKLAVVTDTVRLTDPKRINAWLQLLSDGSIKVFTGKMELGQGISIAIMQVAAEELNVTSDKISIHLAETEVTPDEGITAGSRSIESSAMSVRQAAACAREKLLELAAQHFKGEEFQLEDGMLKSENTEVSFYELLKDKQLEAEVWEPGEYFGKTRRNIVGKPVKRPDLEKMVRAETFYVHDLHFPGMVHARVIRPSSYTSSLVQLDEYKTQPADGFLKLVRQGNFLGVIAAKEFQAVELQKKIAGLCHWEQAQALPQPDDMKKYMKELPADTESDEGLMEWNMLKGKEKNVVKASYSKPYIMHGSNGPGCAVALYDDGKLHVWCHSQGVYPLRKTIAKMLELPEEALHIKGVPGSGCYGHNSADDVAAEAALLAMNYPGKHVRLQWMRQEEHAWEPYGTVMLMEHEAVIDGNGRISAWKYEMWSDTHSTRPTSGDPANLLPARFLDQGYEAPAGGWRGGAIRNADPAYDIELFTLTSHIVKGPLRVSALRGLGAYANIFGIESFMDELAEKAGMDAFEFRIRNLTDTRAMECLKRLKEITAGVKPAMGQGLGIAYSRYKNSASYCAVAALVEVPERSGIPVVKRMWAVIDAGECINPDGLKNQTEGGMIQSASWTLKEKVTFNSMHITSVDWYSYPMLRFDEVPLVEVEVIDRPELPPLGAGEAAQGPASAAITNAIYKATGIRVRDLPVGKLQQ